jgi:hypothetical protein
LSRRETWATVLKQPIVFSHGGCFFWGDLLNGIAAQGDDSGRRISAVDPSVIQTIRNSSKAPTLPNNTKAVFHMSYTNAPDFQDKLRQAINDDLHALPGSRRTGLAIVRMLNKFLRNTLRKDQEVDEINTDHYIRNFAKGKAWRNEHIKELLWEMYVEEKKLILISPDNIADGDVSRVLECFFKPEVPVKRSETNPLAGLIGKFLMYKKSVGAPNKRVVRGFIEFSPAGDGALSFEEVHVYRSGRDRKKPDTEIWIGTLLPHERSYCLISKEKKNGTPKFATLAVIKKDDGRVQSLCGHSIECIQRGDIGPIFQSDIYLERLEDSFDYKTDKSTLDLIDVSKLRKSDRGVLTHLGLG